MANGVVDRAARATETERIAGVRIAGLSNDALVIRLHFTLNHLSRWLTPIHDQSKLLRALRRGEPSVKELLLRLRDEELAVFPLIHAISTRTAPDLDKLPVPYRTPAQQELDQRLLPLTVMAEFRRLRQSTCSVLRGLPDDAWERTGISRREHDWTIRALAERLAHHDIAALAEIDETLEKTGAREGLAAAQRIRLPELLRLVPAEVSRS
jgi:hypothetical protein